MPPWPAEGVAPPGDRPRLVAPSRLAPPPSLRESGTTKTGVARDTLTCRSPRRNSWGGGRSCGTAPSASIRTTTISTIRRVSRAGLRGGVRVLGGVRGARRAIRAGRAGRRRVGMRRCLSMTRGIAMPILGRGWRRRKLWEVGRYSTTYAPTAPTKQAPTPAPAPPPAALADPEPGASTTKKAATPVEDRKPRRRLSPESPRPLPARGAVAAVGRIGRRRFGSRI
mmetsp:Transcript_14084/g.29849  ORF Transcript_14084/g.29849 Transcript_14084/m.29849 type:complete len:225 (+) Transcript_14084:733-1407(+)